MEMNSFALALMLSINTLFCIFLPRIITLFNSEQV
jgi:hypothetical protein